MNKAKAAVAAARWQYLGRLEKGGHALFREIATGRFAIADESGATPSETDDGPLYLDPVDHQTLAINREPTYWLQVVDAKGRVCETTVGRAAMHTLRERFRYMVEEP
jgi:hypothetical protein